MWQRNQTGHVVDVAAHPTDEDPGRRPFRLGPGEEVDFPTLLAGFIEVDPQPDADTNEADAGGDADAAKPKNRPKRAGTAPAPEGDDQ